MKTLHLEIDDELHRELKILVAKRDVTIKKLITDSVVEAIKEELQKEKE